MRNANHFVSTLNHIASHYNSHHLFLTLHLPIIQCDEPHTRESNTTTESESWKYYIISVQCWAHLQHSCAHKAASVSRSVCWLTSPRTHLTIIFCCSAKINFKYLIFIKPKFSKTTGMMISIKHILIVVCICILHVEVECFPQSSEAIARAVKQTELNYYNSDVR